MHTVTLLTFVGDFMGSHPAAFPFPRLLAQTSGSLDGGNGWHLAKMKFLLKSPGDRGSQQQKSVLLCFVSDSFESTCFSGVMRFFCNFFHDSTVTQLPMVF